LKRPRRENAPRREQTPHGKRWERRIGIVSVSQKKGLREAAALKYDPERDVAPEITALGRGVIAEKIIETARAVNIPVYRDEKLAGTLNRLKVGDAIPQELYDVVAEVLVFITGIDRDYGKKYDPYL
jgi:flagellar biosynthesis protein